MALSLHYQTRVLYSCSCSQPTPLTDLYFCRHCKVARCQDCVSANVDTYFCPHCFETSPYAEAKNKKNRCNHCFQCPRCTSTLTTRSIIVPSEVLGEQSPKKSDQAATPSPSTTHKAAALARSPGGTKSYYLSCTHCKWSTRDVGIKDKRSPIDFKEPPSPYQDRISKLVSFYKEFSLRDQAEREKVKKVGRRGRGYGGLLDPSKFLKSSLIDSPTQSRRALSQVPWDRSVIDNMAAQSSDSPDPVPEEFYTNEVDLSKVPMLHQRLVDPIHQPSKVEEFTPRPLHLIGKKLLRCKGCDHILLKAEINPSSIRFKIQQIALHSLPQIRIFEPPNLVPEKPCEVLLSISNPLNSTTSVSFSQLTEDFMGKSGGKLVPVSLPEGRYQVSPNDDMGDLLDGEGEEDLEGASEFVHSRILGKLILKFSVTPVATPDEVKFGFVTTFCYEPTTDVDKQDAGFVVPIPMTVDLGKLAT